MSDLKAQFKDNPYIAQWPADDADVPAYLERVFEGIRETPGEEFQDLQTMAYEALELRSMQGLEDDKVFQGYLNYWRWHEGHVDITKDSFLKVVNAFAEHPDNPHFSDYVERMVEDYAAPAKKIDPLLVDVPDPSDSV